MKTNDTKLYNIIFPVWLLFIFPLTWFIIIPANFIIDSLVLLLVMAILKVERKKEYYKKHILWVFLFGFVSDIIGALFLLAITIIGDGGWLYEYISGPISENPFDNVYSLIFTILCVLIAGLMIYIFNRFVSFRKDSDKRRKRIISLVLAVLTAPYMFLIPTTGFYGGESESFTNHIVWDSYIEAELVVNGEDGEFFEKYKTSEQTIYTSTVAFADAVNLAKKTNKDHKGELQYTITFIKSEKAHKKMEPIYIYECEGDLFFEWKDRTYEIRDTEKLRIEKALKEYKETNVKEAE